MSEDDDDDEPAVLTRKEHRELREMLEDRARRRWAAKLISALAKWIVGVGAMVATIQVGWSNIVKWLVK